jgi:hypothetical protein
MPKDLNSEKEIDAGSKYSETWKPRCMLLRSLQAKYSAACLSDLCDDPQLTMEVSLALKDLD